MNYRRPTPEQIAAENRRWFELGCPRRLCDPAPERLPLSAVDKTIHDERGKVHQCWIGGVLVKEIVVNPEPVAG